MPFLPDAPSRLELLVETPVSVVWLPSSANPASLRVSINGLVQSPDAYVLAANRRAVSIAIPAYPGDTLRLDWQEAA